MQIFQAWPQAPRAPETFHYFARARFRKVLRCVTGEDEVVVLGRQVSGEAGFHQRLASVFAVGKVAVGGRDWLGPGAGPSPAVVSSPRSSMRALSVAR